LIEDDTTKVGNSYQLTASQAKEWMEVYPDLFAQAKVTSDGIIELDKTVVDNYIDGQDAALDAGIEAQITMLEA
jgi:hypothetical protein